MNMNESLNEQMNEQKRMRERGKNESFSFSHIICANTAWSTSAHKAISVNAGEIAENFFPFLLCFYHSCVACE